MKHKIAILSDTHNMIRPEVKEILENADLIFHAGDVANEKTYKELMNFGNIYMVKGNCDHGYPNDLPEDLFTIVFGKKFYMIHDKSKISSEAEKADIVIYGHSHKQELIEEDQIYLNPGSAGPRRFGRPASMMIMEIDSDTGEMEFEVIDLNPPEEKKNKPSTDKVVRAVLRDLKKNKAIADIVNKRNFDSDQVVQIAQIYYTHPGIKASEILDKLDIAGK